MCGIWGFNCSGSGEWNADHVERMIKRADERGGHSHGVYGIKQNGDHVYFKSEGKAKPVLIMEIITECVMAIGQSRLATVGSIDLFNSQPLITKDFAIVHNGNIENYKEIMIKHDYKPSTELDTEAIVPMLRNGEKLTEGAYIALKLNEFDVDFISHSAKLPLIHLKEQMTPNIINHYYCSKEWLQKF